MKRFHCGLLPALPFILLLSLAAGIGLSTFAEAARGTPFVHAHVYGTWWFRMAWTAVFAASVSLFACRTARKGCARRNRGRTCPDFAELRRASRKGRYFPLLLHLGFGMIFVGALATAFTGRKGMLHLREGLPAAEYVDERKQAVRLPFVIQLESFRIEYYPGTDTPADYVSRISCRHADGGVFACPTVSMNHVFSEQGYRFYQTSYDEDLRGSWLSVNYDPWGTAGTYAGFCLSVVGGLAVLCSRGGGFRRLLRHPLMRKGGLLLLILLFGGRQQARPALPVVKRAQADSLASRLVTYNGRVAPFDTPARDFVRKIYGRSSFRGLTPEQVAVSWMLYPEEWNRVPVILIKDAELRAALGLGEGMPRQHGRSRHVSLADLFDGTRYKLQPLWERERLAATREPGGGRSRLARAIQETDEKVGLILMLREGTLFRPLPPGVPRPSAWKIKAELLYNRVPFSKILFMVNLTLGFAAFGLLVFRMLSGRATSASSRRKGGTTWGNFREKRGASREKNRTPAVGEEKGAGRWMWSAALWLVTLFHAAGYALRGCVRGGLPLTDGYETMQFVALAILLTSCLLQRRFPSARASGFLLSGFALLVSALGEMNPQITPLMPVLASPWLSWHVSLIMISYGLFAFTFLNGVVALCIAWKRGTGSPVARGQIGRLTLLSRLLSYPATFLLGTGIVLGAAWANVSWGSYWSWDPKEAWALVSFIVYGISFHRRSLPFLRDPRLFHGYMVLAFGVVLMTYFGVNCLLGGMHSYANPQ